MRFTLDASVHLNALNPAEEGSAESQRLIELLHRNLVQEEGSSHEVFVPTLLLVEIAASAARVLDDTDRGLDAADGVRHLPHQTWIPLDDALSKAAAELGARHRLRGADAVYGAVAERFDSVLVTLDLQQLQRLKPALSVRTLLRH